MSGSLREALAQSLGVGIDRILVGNGSTELIHLLTRACLSPPPAAGPKECSNAALLLTPTYGEYAGACALAGAEVLELEARRPLGFSWDLAQAEEIIQTRRPALVFLCNPNNPTGVYLGKAEVSALARSVAQAGGLLVVDEAYLSFVEERWDGLALLEGDGQDNVVILRSMTKDYALTGAAAGLRACGAGGYRPAFPLPTRLERQRAGPSRRVSGPGRYRLPARRPQGGEQYQVLSDRCADRAWFWRPAGGG